MTSTKYIYQKVEWTFTCSPSSEDCSYYYHVHGPYCPKCHHDMRFKSEISTYKLTKLSEIKNSTLCCSNRNCKNKINTIYDSYSDFAQEAHIEFHAKARGLRETISLDLPPTKIKTRDSDENYFVTTELTQKEGRRLAVIYVGERKNKQDTTDYSQIFIDLDQRQIRFDKSNKLPGEILTSIVCEFKDNKTAIDFKKEK